MPKKAPVKDSDDMTFGNLLASFSVKQWWGLGGAMVSVIIASIAIGGWAQSLRDEAKNAALAASLANATLDLDNAKVQFSAAANTQKALMSKAEFLERFLTYRNAPDDAMSRSLFVNYVCALWKESEERNVRIDSTPLRLSSEQLRAGVSPELERLLISKGIPESFFQQGKDSTEAIATIQKQAESLHVEKIVQFYDGTSYKIPQEIAVTVHADVRCAPVPTPH
jgi:hypothetical protein